MFTLLQAGAENAQETIVIAETTADAPAAATGTEAVTVSEQQIATAPENPGQQPGQFNFLIMIGLMILVLYFFMWRPESKRRKEMAKFREGLKKGDKIITAGGIYGTVKEVKDNTLLIEVDGDVTLRVDKNMVVADSSALQQQK